MLIKFASNCGCISQKDKWSSSFPRTPSWGHLCKLWMFVYQSGPSPLSSFECLKRHFDHFLILRPTHGPTHGPPHWNVVILSWVFLRSGCYFISTFCLRLNVNDARSAIYRRLNSRLQPYINIQHPSRPIIHFRPGKTVTSFIGQNLWQFPTAVCFHLWGSLSSSFHLSQHYSGGLPIKMIPIFITLENAGRQLSRLDLPPTHHI